MMLRAGALSDDDLVPVRIEGAGHAFAPRLVDGLLGDPHTRAAEALDGPVAVTAIR